MQYFEKSATHREGTLRVSTELINTEKRISKCKMNARFCLTDVTRLNFFEVARAAGLQRTQKTLLVEG